MGRPEPPPCVSSLHITAALDRLHDALTDVGVQALDVGKVAGAGHRVPELDHELAGDDLGERRHILDLVLRPLVRAAVVGELVDEGRRVGGGRRLDAVEHALEVVQDVLGAEHELVLGHELGEGDGGLGADEPLRDRVEDRVLAAGVLCRCHPHVDQGVVEAVPRRGVRADRSGLHLGGIDAKVGGVLADEVDQDRVHPDLVRVGDEVLVGGNEVDDPEAPEEGRVHVVDVVLGAVVDSGEDARLGVQAVGDAVLVIAQLAVEDQLEEGLLDAGERPVQLVQHHDHRLAAGPNEPARHAEGHDAVLLHALDVGVAAGVALGHGGAADVDVRQLEGLGARLGEVALADAGGAAHEDCDLGGELRCDLLERLDIHDSCIPVSLRGRCVVLVILEYHRDRPFARGPIDLLGCRVLVGVGSGVAQEAWADGDPAAGGEEDRAVVAAALEQDPSGACRHLAPGVRD